LNKYGGHSTYMYHSSYLITLHQAHKTDSNKALLELLICR